MACGGTSGGSRAARVRAAGGVVCRDGDDGRLEVLLVHRPRYDDWSFPKGKCEPDETYEDAAVREVAEETGFVCELGRELASVAYLDRFGRPKLVRYWQMSVDSGRFRPNDEVDGICWAAMGEARRLLSYEHDGVLLDGLH